MSQNIHLNHIGFLCSNEKQLIVKKGPWREFMIQDMSRVIKEELGDYENWEMVFKGRLVNKQSEMGEYMTGDFSSLKKPGIYRVVLPDNQGHSYQFTISDGIFHPVIRLFMDFVHNWRSGGFSNEWRGQGHLDDGIRSDNGKYHDVAGGWYDAGDTRKWMTMSTLPVISFTDVYEKLNVHWNHFGNEGISDDDLITEACWGLRFILKMQDPETGMIFEEVGAGGDARKKTGMTWWYENHSGCLADNSQNHFTDNIIQSGDERTIRVTYNPIVQYTNLYILLRSGAVLEKKLPEFSIKCIKAAKRIWNFTKTKASDDPLHAWTSVRAWRLMAGLQLEKINIIDKKTIDRMVDDLFETFDEKLGFWTMDTSMTDPYRGILHSAQPIIALSEFLHLHPGGDFARKAKNILHDSWEKYIKPISETNPFGIIPYGVYINPATPKDQYRKWKNDSWFRFFMPVHSIQKINHGLGGHWTSWAHALAWMGKVLDNQKITDLAWKQLFWLWGNNSSNMSMVTGLGYNNPMPHSRFLGTYPGGFCVGPRGNAQDEIFIDRDRRADWGSTEYWLTPLSNALMALAILLPSEIKMENKLCRP